MRTLCCAWCGGANQTNPPNTKQIKCTKQIEKERKKKSHVLDLGSMEFDPVKKQEVVQSLVQTEMQAIIRTQGMDVDIRSIFIELCSR